MQEIKPIIRQAEALIPTPWGNYNVCIESKTENYFTIQLVGDFVSRKFKNIKVDYIVHGSRLDAPLETEQ